MRELEMNTDLSNLESLFELLDQDMEKAGIAREDQFSLHIAVEEIYSNIVYYAYPDPPGPVKIRWDIDRASKVVSVQFKDQGIPYDPLQKEDPDISLSASQREAGGLGIYMVKEMMDGVDYEYTDGYNVLTLKKNVTF